MLAAHLISFDRGNYWTVGIFGKEEEKKILKEIVFSALTRREDLSSQMEGDFWQNYGFNPEKVSLQEGNVNLAWPFITTKKTVSEERREERFMPVCLFYDRKEEGPCYSTKMQAQDKASDLHRERLEGLDKSDKKQAQLLYSLDSI